MSSSPTLLRTLTTARHWQNYVTFRAQFERAAAELAKTEGDVSLRSLTVSKRQFERWTSGELKTQPHPAQCRVLEALFSKPVQQLLGRSPQSVGSTAPTERPNVEQLVNGAASSSARFAQWADSLAVGDLALETLRLRVGQLAVGYVHAPMVPIFCELLAIRDDLFDMLKAPDPGQARDLYLLTGITCGLLAHASGDLGNFQAAKGQTATAMVCARNADHPTLAAWLLAVQALQAEWNSRPDLSLRFAGQAHVQVARELRPSTVGPWTHAIEARAHARLGNTSDAVTALQRAHDARAAVSAPGEEGNALDEIGGILNFPEAKQLFYAGTALRRLGDTVSAVEHAQAAIDAYTSGPADQRSYGDEALARLDLAIAHTSGPHPDLAAVGEALAPVTSLPGSMRLPTLVGSLRDLDRTLTAAPLAPEPEARELRACVSEMIVACQPPRTAVGA